MYLVCFLCVNLWDPQPSFHDAASWTELRSELCTVSSGRSAQPVTLVLKLCSASHSWACCSAAASFPTSCFLLIRFLQSCSPLFFSSATLTEGEEREVLHRVRKLHDTTESNKLTELIKFLSESCWFHFFFFWCLCPWNSWLKSFFKKIFYLVLAAPQSRNISVGLSAALEINIYCLHTSCHVQDLV